MAYLTYPQFLHDPRIVLWLTGPLLAVAGVTAVARDQVFAGAALAQAAVLGMVVALAVPALLGLADPGPIGGDALKACLAAFFCVAAAYALQAAAGRAQGTRAGDHAASGWIVLAAASASCLLASGHEGAAAELGDVVTSAVVFAEPLYVIVFAVALALAVTLAATARRQLVLLTIDPAMAEAVGLRVTAWSLARPLALGGVVAFSVLATGLLYTFGALVLAPLAARIVCRDVTRMFWVAPAVAVAGCAVGIVAATRHGLAPAQLIVAVQCVLLVSAWFVRKAFPRPSS